MHWNGSNEDMGFGGLVQQWERQAGFIPLKNSFDVGSVPSAAKGRTDLTRLTARLESRALSNPVYFGFFGWLLAYSRSRNLARIIQCWRGE